MNSAKTFLELCGRSGGGELSTFGLCSWASCCCFGCDKHVETVKNSDIPSPLLGNGYSKTTILFDAILKKLFSFSKRKSNQEMGAPEMVSPG